MLLFFSKVRTILNKDRHDPAVKMQQSSVC